MVLERDRLQNLLTERRDLFVKACQKYGVPINPTHDGFFAWLEHEEPETIEACAEHHVYLVPLRGGIESVCVRCQLMRSNESQRHLQPYSTR